MKDRLGSEGSAGVRARAEGWHPLSVQVEGEGSRGSAGDRGQAWVTVAGGDGLLCEGEVS